jgi:hypothetical protein
VDHFNRNIRPLEMSEHITTCFEPTDRALRAKLYVFWIVVLPFCRGQERE